MPSDTSSSVPGRPPAWRRRLHRHRGPVLALLVGLLVWSLTSAFRPPTPEVVQVLVAARDLLPGTTLAADDLVTVSLPASARPSDAPSDPSGLLGRQVVVPLLAGDPVLARHLLTAGLLAGYGSDVVATPLRLADPSALAVLRPGDVVDVIAAISGGSMAGGDGRASVVASRVRVLLTSASGSPEAGGGVLSAPAGTDSSSVVLATTSQQALAIARAAVGSRLSVVLRGG